MRVLLAAALLPTLLYVIVYLIFSYRAKTSGQIKPKFFSPMFLKAFISSLILAIFFFFLIFGYNLKKNVSVDYSSTAQKLQKKKISQQ